MSQMPNPIFLHKDEKYNTGDFHIAYRKVHLEIKSFDEDVNMDDYVPYINKKDLLAWLEYRRDYLLDGFAKELSGLTEKNMATAFQEVINYIKKID